MSSQLTGQQTCQENSRRVKGCAAKCSRRSGSRTPSATGSSTRRAPPDLPSTGCADESASSAHGGRRAVPTTRVQPRTRTPRRCPPLAATAEPKIIDPTGGYLAAHSSFGSTGPLRLGRSPARALMYLPACSHGSVRTKHDLSSPSSSRRFRAAKVPRAYQMRRYSTRWLALGAMSPGAFVHDLSQIRCSVFPREPPRFNGRCVFYLCVGPADGPRGRERR